LALLSTGERYPEPLRTALRELWMRYNRSVEWTTGPSWVAELRDTPLFGEVAETNHQTGLRLPAEAIVGVECTRATFLSYSETDQAGFAADLRRLLEPSPYVELVRETLLGMGSYGADAISSLSSAQGRRWAYARQSRRSAPVRR
jgi:hypothetical protein